MNGRASMGCKKQTAIEGGSCPEWRGRPQSEGVRKECPVRHAGIAKEAVDRVEEAGQPLGVEARRQAPLDEAFP